MKKLVIFDLDGTLLNTIADLAAATNQALEKLHYPARPRVRRKMSCACGSCSCRIMTRTERN